ncbi:unnamed protein product, partial [Closterium sp. Naga37s-1]
MALVPLLSYPLPFPTPPPFAPEMYVVISYTQRDFNTALLPSLRPLISYPPLTSTPSALHSPRSDVREIISYTQKDFNTALLPSLLSLPAYPPTSPPTTFPIRD